MPANPGLRRSRIDLSGWRILHSSRPAISVFCLALAAFYFTSAPGQDLGVSFVDVAEEAGLTDPNVWGGLNQKTYIIEAKGSGLGFLDYDADGWIDIYTTNGVRFEETYEEGKAPISRLYRNQQDGSFSDVTRQAGLGRTGWQTGVCVGDFDDDGWIDLFTAEWGYNILYRNTGNGRFEDVTVATGLRDKRPRWASGCSFLDFDRDGHLDLFVANYIELDLNKVPRPGEDPKCSWKGLPVVCGPRGLPGGSNLLYRNRGDGTFEDVSEKSGILAPGPTYSITAVAADFNNDLWPDVYVAVDSRQSLLFMNLQNGTFEEVGMISGCAFSEDGLEQAGMGVGIGDFNADGWLDIFKTNFQHESANLYQNNGDGTFREVSIRAGLGINTQFVCWGAGFVDIDNDSLLDIFHVTGHVYPEIQTSQLGIPLKTPRLVYRNLGDGRFEDASSRLGPGVNQTFASRGSAYGDFDNDGDVDVLVLNMNDRPSLLRCDNRTGNNWSTLRLVGANRNRAAIGARAKIISGTHTQYGEVRSGGSVMSQDDLRLHFGLGKASAIEAIEVTWPATGTLERIENPPLNRILTIREGQGLQEQ